ncbi:unnamed protein product [Penicillium bialowiezense]
MAFRMLTPSSSILRLGLGVGIGLSAATMHPLSPFRAAPMLCDYASPLPQQSTFKKEPEWAVNGKPAQKSRTGLLNAESMRQISLGSVMGLVAGVGLRAFSKALVVILGMGVVLVEYAASKGYNILPLHRLQKYVKNVDLHRAMNQHRPFKISFGAMMAMAAFANF